MPGRRAIPLATARRAAGLLAARPWAATTRLMLAGTSEGSVAVARQAGAKFAAPILYAWSCEPNDFIQVPRNAVSANDPSFSPADPWIGSAEANGHCGAALRDDPNAAVVLAPDAPHALLQLPAARDAAAGFLSRALHLGADATASAR